MERTVARKLAQDLEKRNVLPQTKEGRKQKKKPPGKTQPDSHTMFTKYSRGSNNKLAVAVDLEDAYNRMQFRPLMELCTIWRQLDAYRTPAKKGRHATLKLDLYAPTTDNGTSTRFSLPPVLYNVYTKGPADLTSNGLNRLPTLADDGPTYKTACDTTQQSPLSRSWWKKCHNGVKRQSPKSVQARRKPCGAPLTRKQQGK